MHRLALQRILLLTAGLAVTATAALYAAPPQSAKPQDTPRFKPTQLTPSRQIDERRAQAAGIRKIAGRHLTLFTDLPSSPEVDELPAAFDQAFPQWCDYFGLDAKELAAWHMRGFLMKEHAKFQATDLAPANLPEIVNGYTIAHEFWMFHQSSDYYQRHLLLHEGVHGFMFTLLGGAGPPWYTEGMAELLGTHRWAEGKLAVNYFPKRSADVPRLGRVEIVQTAFAGNRAKRLTDVISFDNRAHKSNDAYGWCWAAAAFLDGHPAYRERFRQLPQFVNSQDFNSHFAELFAADWSQLQQDWQILVADLEYGYDFQATAVEHAAGKDLGKSAKVSIAADQGWQNTGLQLKPGVKYRLKASGQFQVADKPKPWISEAGGVSIRYYHGRPLGQLLAVLRPDEASEGSSAFLKPKVIGLGTTVTVAKPSTLFLRINDSAGELRNNAGSVTVDIEALKP